MSSVIVEQKMGKICKTTGGLSSRCGIMFLKIYGQKGSLRGGIRDDSFLAQLPPPFRLIIQIFIIYTPSPLFIKRNLIPDNILKFMQVLEVYNFCLGSWEHALSVNQHIALKAHCTLLKVNSK